jgi:hypothetical protein
VSTGDSAFHEPWHSFESLGHYPIQRGHRDHGGVSATTEVQSKHIGRYLVWRKEGQFLEHMLCDRISVWLYSVSFSSLNRSGSQMARNNVEKEDVLKATSRWRSSSIWNQSSVAQLLVNVHGWWRRVTSPEGGILFIGKELNLYRMFKDVFSPGFTSTQFWNHSTSCIMPAQMAMMVTKVTLQN